MTGQITLFESNYAAPLATFANRQGQATGYRTGGGSFRTDSNLLRGLLTEGHPVLSDRVGLRSGTEILQCICLSAVAVSHP